MDFETMKEITSITILLLFVSVFGVVLFWALRPSNKKRFEQDAQIPLKEE